MKFRKENFVVFVHGSMWLYILFQIWNLLRHPGNHPLCITKFGCQVCSGVVVAMVGSRS
jgi:hypothetical protein